MYFEHYILTDCIQITLHIIESLNKNNESVGWVGYQMTFIVFLAFTPLE